jgi:CRP-like cAMP-binding protein
MEALLTYLNSLHPLSTDLVNYLVEHLQTRSLPKKDFLLKAGRTCHQICFVESGLLRCYYTNGEPEVCSWFLKEGDVIISIESFYLQKESHESIQALEDTTLHYLNYSDLQYIYRQFLEFNVVGRILTEKYYQLCAQQLYGLRMKQAPERYQWLLNNESGLILRVPAKYLASYLGISEVMLSIVKGRR